MDIGRLRNMNAEVRCTVKKACDREPAARHTCAAAELTSYIKLGAHTC